MLKKTKPRWAEQRGASWARAYNSRHLCALDRRPVCYFLRPPPRRPPMAWVALIPHADTYMCALSTACPQNDVCVTSAWSLNIIELRRKIEIRLVHAAPLQAQREDHGAQMWISVSIFLFFIYFQCLMLSYGLERPVGGRFHHRGSPTLRRSLPSVQTPCTRRCP